MTYPSLAVIGTAGRKEDKRYLTQAHYDRMVRAAMKLIRHLDLDQDELKLYSGGAAWADHVVVSLAILGIVKFENVTLYLPTELSEDGFVGQDERASKTASTANYYHQIFSDTIVANSIQQLLAIRDAGASLIPGTGNFFQRNSLVAKAVSPGGLLLAFTFGEPDSQQTPWTLKPFPGDTKAVDAGLKDGGTADTWNKTTCQKWHGLIGKTSREG